MKKPVYKRVYGDLDDGAERIRAADREWKALILDLSERNQLTNQRLRIVDRLVRERVEYEFLAPIVALEGPVQRGPNGGDVFNFKWSALQKVKDQILKLETALGLIVDKSAAGTGPPPKKTKASKYLDRLGSN